MGEENRYQLRDVTPRSLACPPIGGCPAIYENIREVTPPALDCAPLPGCLGVYEAQSGGKRDDCVIGACPDIHERGDVYLIIGKQVDPRDANLVEKVGEGEVLIEVPRALIDEMERR